MRRALVALAFAFGAPLAAAQAGGGAAPGSGPAKAPRAAASSGSPPADASRQAWSRTHRASRIIGMDVMNRQGEKVGDIEDIVLDRNGSVAYAVVSTGGFLGVGERLHAVPWRALKADDGATQFLLDIDKETLARAPGFDNTSFPDVNDPKWSAANRKHFAVASRAPAPSSTMGPDPAAPNTRERNDPRPGSGRAPLASDIGPATSTARRGGPAAGAGSSAAPDAGSTSGTAAGSTGTADRAVGTTNPAGTTGSPPGTAHPATGSDPTPGTVK